MKVKYSLLPQIKQGLESIRAATFSADLALDANSLLKEVNAILDDDATAGLITRIKEAIPKYELNIPTDRPVMYTDLKKAFLQLNSDDEIVEIIKIIDGLIALSSTEVNLTKGTGNTGIVNMSKEQYAEMLKRKKNKDEYLFTGADIFLAETVINIID